MIEDPFVRIAKALAEHGEPRTPARTLSCYVALGDSFTAGTGCPPGLGWADRVAAALQLHQSGFVYRNLAADGATSEDVLGQLGEAQQLEPDLVTVVCGANDVLRSTRPDALGYARRLSRIFRRLGEGAAGLLVVTATSPEVWDFMPLGPRTRQRVQVGMQRFNRVTRQVAGIHGVELLDVAAHPGLRDPANFASDGLHPSVQGHARAAEAFMHLLRERLRIPPPSGKEIEHERD